MQLTCDSWVWKKLSLNIFVLRTRRKTTGRFYPCFFSRFRLGIPITLQSIDIRTMASNKSAKHFFSNWRSSVFRELAPPSIIVPKTYNMSSSSWLPWQIPQQGRIKKNNGKTLELHGYIGRGRKDPCCYKFLWGEVGKTCLIEIIMLKKWVRQSE